MSDRSSALLAAMDLSSALHRLSIDIPELRNLDVQLDFLGLDSQNWRHNLEKEAKATPQSVTVTDFDPLPGAQRYEYTLIPAYSAELEKLVNDAARMGYRLVAVNKDYIIMEKEK